MWKSWPQNHAKFLDRIDRLSREQLRDLIFQYSGLHHVTERLEALRFKFYMNYGFHLRFKDDGGRADCMDDPRAYRLVNP